MGREEGGKGRKGGKEGGKQHPDTQLLMLCALATRRQSLAVLREKSANKFRPVLV